MRWDPRTSRFSLLAVVAACVPAMAQPPDAAQLVKDLASPDAATRLAASETLLQDQGITLRQLEESLLHDELSLEQRYRLMSVARRRFDLGPRPAMGVSFDRAVREAGVRIDQLYPQFPAARVLKMGDRIDSIDGRRIGEMLDARAVILAHDPGDELEMTVFRDGVAQSVTVPLGRYADLPQAGAPDEPSLAMAWELRSRPYAALQADKPTVVECGVGAEAWAAPDQAAADTRPRTRARTRVPADETQQTAVVAGGESRGAAEDENLFTTGTATGGGFRIVGGNANEMLRQNELLRQVDRQERQLARATRDRLLALVRDNEARLADSNTPEAERIRLTQESAVLRRQISVVDAQLAALEARLRAR